MKHVPTFSPNRHSGFSLVELLVVVAIIVILLALLMPNAARIKDKAAIIQCATNLEQLGTGVRLWSTDNDGRYPDKWWGTMYAWYGTSGKRGGTYTSKGAASRPLNRYVGGPYQDEKSDVPTARCPKDKQSWIHPTQTHYEHFGASYGSNSKLPARYDYDQTYPRGLTKEDGSLEGRQFSAIKSAGNFVMMTEEGPFMAVWWSRSLWDARDSEKVFWHDPWRWNAVFADGHVSYITVRNEEWRGYDYSFDYRF